MDYLSAQLNELGTFDSWRHADRAFDLVAMPALVLGIRRLPLRAYRGTGYRVHVLRHELAAGQDAESRAAKEEHCQEPMRR